MTRAPIISSIAVIVVNYGTAELAIAAVESVLQRHHGGRDVEVHLVDNASPTEDAVVFKRVHKERGWRERVVLHLETENHGFGRGNNIVLQNLLHRDIAPEAVVLLNPDARLDNEAIDLLAQNMETHPHIGFAGAGIEMPNGIARSAAFRFPSVVSEFIQSLNFGPVTQLLSQWQVPLPPGQPSGEVDWVSGAALAIRTDVLRQVGLFDPDFFLYYEEVELMWRGHRAGWLCRYVAEARVLHEEGAATDVKSMRSTPKRHPAYRYESWRLYHLKTRGRVGALLTASAALSGALGSRVISAIRGRQASGVPHFVKDFWKYSVCPLLLEFVERESQK